MTVLGSNFESFKTGFHFLISRPEISRDTCFCLSAVYSFVDLSFDPFYPNLGYSDFM